MKLSFITSGLRTTTQDDGRYGHTQIGVPIGGAMDKAAMYFANIQVGNPPTSPVLEMTLLGPRLKCESAGCIALSGADFGATVNGKSVPRNTPIQLSKGDEVSFAPATNGCRGYLAVQGRWMVEKWLGSASALRIGSQELLPSAVWTAGDILNTAPRTVAPWPSPVLPPKSMTNRLAAYKGPEFAALGATAIATLTQTAITVCEPSNRVGLRTNTKVQLEGEASGREMVSSGVMPGTIQITPDGQAIVVLADGQTIGGYPRVLQCASKAIDRLGQLRAGDEFYLDIVDL